MQLQAISCCDRSCACDCDNSLFVWALAAAREGATSTAIIAPERTSKPKLKNPKRID
ncbi:hypothetical protein NDI47_24985 [Microcoleus vaginatus GB1-A2]|uniref:hypothetical protein n=1 Tax=Microcoleus vaginatus TaxID=119532 RepID=UPI0019B4CBED|nr:hypothetical protein [Microcoleus sp. FACHB-61]